MIFTWALILHKLRTIKRFHFTTRTAIQCSHDLNALFSTCTLNRRLSNLDRWSSEIVVERLSASWEVIMNNDFFFFLFLFYPINCINRDSGKQRQPEAQGGHIPGQAETQWAYRFSSTAECLEDRTASPC